MTGDKKNLDRELGYQAAMLEQHAESITDLKLKRDADAKRLQEAIDDFKDSNAEYLREILENAVDTPGGPGGGFYAHIVGRLGVEVRPGAGPEGTDMADKLDITDALIARAETGDLSPQEYQVLGLKFMQRSFVINTITHEYLREVRALERFKVFLFVVVVFYIVAKNLGWL